MQAYLLDSYAKQLRTSVAAVIDANHVVLTDTVFYPSGGGQPTDTGALVRESDGKEFAVTLVKKENGQMVHEVDQGGLAVGDEVLCSIDWERRYKLMRMHTAAHILCAIINKHTGALITGNQLDVERSRIDFNLDQFDKAAIERYVAEANASIAKGAPVTISSMKREAAMAVPHLVKLAGALPPSIAELRIVKIGDIDEQADGGTHVKDANEIGTIKVISLENKGKNNRRMYFSLEHQ
ncbi:alanyl-tRNA editing protein [Candidatus Woesearchaeota archaeon]|nr:alanyl-tRNA editing protein [Candidatus Woesearchaeota archaeon]